ncbi:MAG TPA: DUF6165 family protein [Candidatus Acidoferrales bacterium]|nr:DUF6165 family protein [Candidatus Acidoferrales bacterium]
MSEIQIPVSYGELIDKITILEIKQARITDPVKRRNVSHELTLLQAVWDASDAARGGAIDDLRVALKAVNEALWDIEDDIRDKERAQAFDAAFIALARAVYHQNDRRAALKREINLRLGSAIIEEKSYADYGSP